MGGEIRILCSKLGKVGSNCEVGNAAGLGVRCWINWNGTLHYLSHMAASSKGFLVGDTDTSAVPALTIFSAINLWCNALSNKAAVSRGTRCIYLRMQDEQSLVIAQHHYPKNQQDGF
jgi:hypothetical protein